MISTFLNYGAYLFQSAFLGDIRTKMYSSDSDSPAVCEEDEEGKLYQLVFELGTTNNKEEGKEEVQIPSSSEKSPEYQQTDGERTYAVGRSNPVECSTVDNTCGLDTDALDNNQAVPVQKIRPWRKPGADITDYFNYGFDEKSWNAYCKKHAKARAARKKMYTKIKVQERQTRYEEESCPHSLPGSSSILSSRESRATLDVIGGRPGSRGRVEGRRCLSDEENISQELTEMSFEEDLSTSHHSPSLSNFSSPFAYIPPPPFLYRPGTPASSAFASSNSQHFDAPSTLQRRSSSGASSLIPRGMASNAGVINTAKAWERYIWQEKCDTARDRSREHSRDEDSDRGTDRDGDRERRSSTHSGEERTRRRDTTERGHKHHSLAKPSGEKKDKRHREKRHRDNNEGGSSSSSSSKERKDGGEEGESQSRKKRKRARKKRKEKETNKMSSADQERKLKSD